MRLTVIVERNRESRAECGECSFCRPKLRPPFCELFNVALPDAGNGEQFRINDCFAAQRMGEDPTCRSIGIEE